MSLRQNGRTTQKIKGYFRCDIIHACIQQNIRHGVMNEKLERMHKKAKQTPFV